MEWKCASPLVAGVSTNDTAQQRRFSRLGKGGWVKCEQTDFGAWVACVTKSQITDFITHVYCDKEDLPWVVDSLKDLKMFVAELSDTKSFGLVATEW